MNVNDKLREVAKETEALVEEIKRLEDSLRKQHHLKNEYKQMADEAIAQVQELREPRTTEPKVGLETVAEDIANTLNSIAEYLRVADDSILKEYSIASDGDSSTEELVLSNGLTVTIEHENN